LKHWRLLYELKQEEEEATFSPRTNKEPNDLRFRNQKKKVVSGCFFFARKTTLFTTKKIKVFPSSLSGWVKRKKSAFFR